MITYHAGKVEIATAAGTIALELRFASSKQVVAVLSPEAARYLARELMDSADDAEAYRAPDMADAADPLADEDTE